VGVDGRRATTEGQVPDENRGGSRTGSSQGTSKTGSRVNSRGIPKSSYQFQHMNAPANTSGDFTGNWMARGKRQHSEMMHNAERQAEQQARNKQKGFSNHMGNNRQVGITQNNPAGSASFNTQIQSQVVSDANHGGRAVPPPLGSSIGRPQTVGVVEYGYDGRPIKYDKYGHRSDSAMFGKIDSGHGFDTADGGAGNIGNSSL
jgi:hypothetical protein